MTGLTWVFGYGSLVSPTSLASTLGRPAESIRSMPAELTGFGRRWNYGSLTLRGSWRHHGETVSGIVVSLGLEASESERCNGVVVAVTEEELGHLDWRERDYERTEVTDRIRLDGGTGPAGPTDGPVVTYVPRPSAVERYLSARNAGRAAVRRSYWDLVHTAFGHLGDAALQRFTAHTPPPDVPIAEVELARSS